jgi:aminoglycoside phosphotransferase (APT) family kinase protein
VGVPVVLTERLPGTRQPDQLRLRALGAVAAQLHSALLEPSAALPARDRPISGEDFAGMRQRDGASRLLREADALIARMQPAAERTVFVYGDLWHGNTLWAGGSLSGLVDWDCAGAGAPGVDLGPCAAMPRSASGRRQRPRRSAAGRSRPDGQQPTLPTGTSWRRSQHRRTSGTGWPACRSTAMCSAIASIISCSVS